jgi:hypothetical protein
MPLKSTEGENLLLCRTNVLTKKANCKKITHIFMFLDRIWYLLSVFLENQENISVLVGISTKKSQFFWLCDLGSVFGFVLRRFPRKVFCFLQFWALEGSIHLLLSAISFLMTGTLYRHPYYYSKSDFSDNFHKKIIAITNQKWVYKRKRKWLHIYYLRKLSKNCARFMRVNRILKVWSLLSTKIIFSAK